MPVYGFWPNQTDSSRAAGAAQHTMLRRISSRFHRTRKDPCADVHTQEVEPRVRFTVASVIGNNSLFLFHFHPLCLPHLLTTYGAAIALYLGCPHKHGCTPWVCVCVYVYVFHPTELIGCDRSEGESQLTLTSPLCFSVPPSETPPPPVSTCLPSPTSCLPPPLFVFM